MFSNVCCCIFISYKCYKKCYKVRKRCNSYRYWYSRCCRKVYNAVVIVSTYKDDAYIASGTGFVYKKDGNKYYILTNHHVIDGGNKVTITFTDGKVVETKVVGSDQYSDIAVLSMESKDELTVASLGKMIILELVILHLLLGLL